MYPLLENSRTPITIAQDTNIEEYDESFFQLPENETEREKRDAIKLKNRNKKKRSGFEREKKETMQKEKNFEKMTKIFNQVETEQRKQAQAKQNQIFQDLGLDVNNMLSDVKQGAQNVVSNLQRGMNRKSARLQQSLRFPKNQEPKVTYENLKNQSGASSVSVAISSSC